MAKRRGKTKKKGKRLKKSSKTSSSQPDTDTKSDNDNNIIREELKNFKETISGLEGKIDKMEKGFQKAKKELDDARKFVSEEIKKQQASEMLGSSEPKSSKKEEDARAVKKSGAPKAHLSLDLRNRKANPDDLQHEVLNETGKSKTSQLTEMPQASQLHKSSKNKKKGKRSKTKKGKKK